MDGEDYDKARDLHERSIILIMHDHNRLNQEVPRLLSGGVTGLVFKLSVDVNIGANIQDSAKRFEGFAKSALISMDGVYCYMKKDKRIIPCFTASDIVSAKQEGKVAVILGNEGGKLLEGNLALLRMFYRLGLREMQLTWSVPNHLCWRKPNEGLTDFGEAVIKEMNRLGIIIDVSHIPQSALIEVLEISKDPVVISHGTAGVEQTLESHKDLSERGGILGQHFYTGYLHHFFKRDDVHANIEHLMDAIDYDVEHLGIDGVALGADFFPTSNNRYAEWGDYIKKVLKGVAEWAIDNPSVMMEVTRGLVIRGYSDNEIKKILGGNFLRVCKKVFGK